MFFPHLPSTYCEEVAASAPHKKVYFFMQLDFWYYQRCGYEPPSYEEPVALSLLKQPLTSELGDLLDRGYTSAMLKGEVMAPLFADEYAPELSVHRVLTSPESAHYRFIQRGPAAAKPTRRRPRPLHAAP